MQAHARTAQDWNAYMKGNQCGYYAADNDPCWKGLYCYFIVAPPSPPPASPVPPGPPPPPNYCDYVVETLGGTCATNAVGRPPSDPNPDPDP